MQTQIHPKYFEEVTVTCSCGNTFTAGSTKSSISVEVCSKCHPFYTGEQRFLDTKGTVDKFLKKQQEAKKYQAKMASKQSKKQTTQDRSTKSLKELLSEA